MAHENFITRCMDALDHLTGEDARKVEYVAGQLLNGDREDADCNLLIDTVRKIVDTPAPITNLEPTS